jgi:hypothetical protein
MTLQIVEPKYSIRLSVVGAGDIALQLQKGANMVLNVSPLVTVINQDGGGQSNVFIQEDDPALQTPYMWVETNPDGGVKTIWVNS